MMSKLVRGRSVWVVALMLAIGAVALLAGCGGSSSSSSESEGSTNSAETESGSATTAATEEEESAGGGESSAVEAAKAEFEKFIKPQPDIEIPPVPKKPPTGTKLTVVTCPLPVCRAETDPAKKAAEELGWSIEYLQTELTPEAYQATMDQVVAKPPEALSVIASIPYEVIEKQIKELAAKKVPIVAIAPIGIEPNEAGPVLGVVTGPPQFGQSGRLMGDAVVADHGEGAKTVFITDPSLKGVWGPVQEEFTKVVTGAGGEVEELQVEAAQIGKSIPTQVTSYVQSHSDVEYLAFALNDLTVGVPQALESAGLNESVKIVSRAPQPANLENIKNGVEWTSVAEENSAGGYRSIDQLVRAMQGVPLGELANPAGWAQIINSESVTETDAVPTTPGFPTVFQEAWHLK